MSVAYRETSLLQHTLHVRVSITTPRERPAKLIGRRVLGSGEGHPTVTFVTRNSSSPHAENGETLLQAATDALLPNPFPGHADVLLTIVLVLQLSLSPQDRSVGVMISKKTHHMPKKQRPFAAVSTDRMLLCGISQSY